MSIASHDGKQGFAPQSHAAAAGRDDGFPADEVGGFGFAELEAMGGGEFEDLGDAGFLHEAVAAADAPESGVEFFDLDAILWGDVGILLHEDGEKHDAFVEDFVVFEIVEEGDGSAVGIAGEVDGGAWHAESFAALEILDEGGGGQGGVLHAQPEQLAATFPCCHEREDDDGDGDGEPAAVGEFKEIGEAESDFEGEGDAHGGGGLPPGPIPELLGCEEKRTEVTPMVMVTARP